MTDMLSSLGIFTVSGAIGAALAYAVWRVISRPAPIAPTIDRARPAAAE